jgi:serine/threonine protein kinase
MRRIPSIDVIYFRLGWWLPPMKSCPTCHSTYPSDFSVCPRDATTLIEVELWSEGTLVRGKYRVLGKVGVGGMAVVYKALHIRFDELRALKVMAPELASDQQFVKRFMHEAVITRKLQHPNAVRLDDIDEAEDGRPFIVMEYIEGRSLKEAIQLEAPMAVERVCSIVRQVASALDAAHQLGMVHRDIKPANIVLVGGRPRAGVDVPVDRAKVLDFGIAKIKEAHLRESRVPMPTMTGTGFVIGTPAYMSPEQAIGKRGSELDGRSDLYSLGIVMYEMLTGELPLKADSEMQMILAQINTVPPDVRTKRPDVPEAIGHLVMRCLEKMANQRPVNAQGLIDGIERWEVERGRMVYKKSEKRKIDQRANKIPDSDPSRFRAVTNASSVFAPPVGRPVALGHRMPVDPSAIPPAARTSLESSTPPENRHKFWLVVLLVAAATGFGIWYFSMHSVNFTKGPSTRISAPRGPSEASDQGANRETVSDTSQTAKQDVNSNHPKERERFTAQGPAKNGRREVASDQAKLSSDEDRISKTNLEKQTKGWITEADADYDDGLYNDAIALYEKALKIDPNNQEIQKKIERARRAKDTEESIH